MDPNGTTSIENLPNEILLLIFEQLSKKNLLVLSLVSKRFNRLSDREQRFRIGSRIIYITRLPSLKLQRFGSSINRLSFAYDVDEENVDQICELCPNFKELHCDGLSAGTFS